jgi:putative endonuclease
LSFKKNVIPSQRLLNLSEESRSVVLPDILKTLKSPVSASRSSGRVVSSNPTTPTRAYLPIGLFMTHFVYILYSELSESYYTGETLDPDLRLRKHISNHTGYTSIAKDWRIVFQKECDSKSEALKLERRIKKRGAARYLDDLKKSG